MDFISILLFFVNIISILGMLIIASFVAVGNSNKEKLFFAAVVYTAAVWLLLQYLVQVFSIDGNLGLNIVQFVTALSFPMAFFFYLFTREHIKQVTSFKVYIIGAIAFVVELFLNIFGFIVQKAEGHDNSVVISEVSWLYTAYIIVIGFMFCLSFIKILKNSHKISLHADKIGNRFLIIGIAQAVLILAVVSLLFQSTAIEIQILLPLSLLIMSIMIGYAITRHGLFDIRLAIVRSVTYTALIITLAGVYSAITFVASSLFNFGKASIGQIILNISISLGLVFLFQPLKRFFDKITNKIFYKDAYNTDDFFEKLNKILGFTTDLRGLLERTAVEIAKTLKGEQALFFINTSEGHFATAGTPKHKQLPKSDVDQFSNVPLGKNGVIIASLMEDSDPIKRIMISHRIELVLPLVQDSNIIGYLCLGDHLTSNYTSRDIKVLNTISNELIIAIQNALAVQEIREFNITLQQRIANATRELRASNAQLRHLDKAKDEFLSMASHQLRTPLTSVKGYISMILDGDAGKVSPDQKNLLGEAFNNSERMVSLINDFLSISRIQTGRFVIEKTPIDLSLVVEQEVNSLRTNATARQMELVYERPENLPIMDIDEGKIRQVIMNFIDNAIYYSHPNTKININLNAQTGEILFTVKDTGIGVPKAERDQLFTKFFRATNAKKTRPDGSGVGLFLAKKVVDDHGGKIIFDSIEGKGSTFGFSLPIKPLVTVDAGNK